MAHFFEYEGIGIVMLLVAALIYIPLIRRKKTARGPTKSDPVIAGGAFFTTTLITVGCAFLVAGLI